MMSRYLSLQQLRGLAALLVVIAHTTEYPLAPGAPVPFWTSRVGELGVQIFFIISGFIITVVTGPGRFKLPTFLWRRALRVVPLYWLCTTAVLILALAAPAAFKTTTGSWSDFVLSLLFIPHAAPGDALANHWSPMLKPGWTLNLEVFFYLVVAALFWCPKRRIRSIAVSALLGVLLVLSFTVDMRTYGVLDFYANSNFLAFLFGVWLAEAVLDARATAPLPPAMLLLTLCGALIATVALFTVQSESAVMALALCAAGLIVFAAIQAERLGRLPVWPVFLRIGDASYSLYLTHLFTLGLLWTAIRHVAGPAQGLIHLGGVVLTAVASVAVALVSYRVVELPFIKLSHSRGTSVRAKRPAEVLAGIRPGGRLSLQDGHIAP